MGAVYLATDAQMPGQKWAIKEMSVSQLQPQEIPQAIRDFQNEAALLKRLRHANLPQAQSAFEQNGRWYFAMEFIEGENLLQRLSARGRSFEEAVVLEWARQLCEVLEYLHTQQPPIIFRDLKPANIMVTPANQIKLIDFGIARFFKPNQTRDTTPWGSHEYAALEQFGNAQTDARTDIHALGATLYHLLTGNPPPKASERALDPQLLISALRANKNVSARTSSVLEKALAVHPNSRYPSVRELRAALFPTPTRPAPPRSTQPSPTLRPPAPPVTAKPTPTAQPFHGTTASLQKIQASEIETNLNALMLWDLSFPAIKLFRKREATLVIRNHAQTALQGTVRALVPWLRVPNGNFSCPPGIAAQVKLEIDGSQYPVTQLLVEPLEIVW